jgi:1-acyl-sn-glycerol-3-phosphate acyltransferase
VNALTVPPHLAGPVKADALPTLRGGRLRATGRILGIALWSTGLTLLWLLGQVLLLARPGLRVRWRHRIVGTWARGFARLIGMRIEVSGVPPAAPFFLVSNHLSYIDIILLYTRIDGVFIAKQEMRRWPVLGPLAKLFGTLWLNREVSRDAVRVLDLIDDAIARGDGVILFPEGTTSNGQAPLPLRPALLDWAARKQYPVHYCSLTYRARPGAPPASATIGWWGAMPFGRHALNLSRLPGFDARIDFGPTPLVAPTRGELAERLQREIGACFIPLL